MTHLHAYKDGERLILVMENAGDQLENLIKSLLPGDMQQVRHLAEPDQAETPKLDFKSMDELPISPTPGNSPKFVRNKNNNQVGNLQEPDVQPETEGSDRIKLIGSQSTNESTSVMPDRKLVERMSIFQLRAFIRKHATDRRLLPFLTKLHTDYNQLEHTLHVKSEQSVRELAMVLVS